MNKEYAAYRRFFVFVNVFVHLFYRFRVTGAERIRDGAAMVCANHSSWVDPFLVAIAFGKRNHLRIMGKVELFRIPVVGWFLRRIGMFPVDRSVKDVTAIRTAMKLIRDGSKVVIFPEGTRVAEDDAVIAKSGAVKIADHMSVPVYPVFIPRKKPVFSRVDVIIGEPITFEKQAGKRSNEDYVRMADELMGRIRTLAPAAVKS